MYFPSYTALVSILCISYLKESDVDESADSESFEDEYGDVLGAFLDGRLLHEHADGCTGRGHQRQYDNADQHPTQLVCVRARQLQAQTERHYALVHHQTQKQHPHVVHRSLNTRSHSQNSTNLSECYSALYFLDSVFLYKNNYKRHVRHTN